MTIPRIYSPGQRGAEAGGTIELGREDLHYLKHVLRLKPGDRVAVFDGSGCEYLTNIDRYAESGVILAVSAMERRDKPPVRITLAQSLPKESKMDIIIQKATELGVWRIRPFISSRTVPRLTEEKGEARVKRWQKIAAEAAKQCAGTHVPEVTGIVRYGDIIGQRDSKALNIIFWEEESKRGIKEILRDAALSEKEEILIVIGPEGGFTRDEAATAVENGFLSAHLGRQILRVETASLAVLAIIQYERGLIGSPVTGEE